MPVTRNLGWRMWLAGALTPPAVGLALMNATVLGWPETSITLMLQRVAENLVPQLVVVGILLALALAAIGWKRLSISLIVLNLMGGMLVALMLWRDGVPSAPHAERALSVLWFNMLRDNPKSPTELIAAFDASGADIVILAEALPMRSYLDTSALRAAFPVQAGCRGARCELLVLARDPAARISIRHLYPPRSERIARVEIGGTDSVPNLTVLGMHLYKPWYFGQAAHDNWFAVDEIGKTRGPLALFGDFNAAPWSYRMRIFRNMCDMRGPHLSPATWPVGLGRFGVPIDQVMTRSGARIIRITSWGRNMGSNHLGLLADIGLDGGAPTVLQDCQVPLDASLYPVRPIQP